MPDDRETLRAKLKADFHIWAADSGRPASFGLLLRLLFLHPGYQLALSIRLRELCGRVPVIGGLLRRIAWYASTIWFSCDIDQYAQIGGGIHFPHPVGIVIGGRAKVGRNVTILQNSTLGIVDYRNMTGPTIGDGARVGAGSHVLGAISIGAGAVVGANAVVLKDVPDGWRAAGVPAKIFPPKELAPT